MFMSNFYNEHFRCTCYERMHIFLLSIINRTLSANKTKIVSKIKRYGKKEKCENYFSRLRKNTFVNCKSRFVRFCSDIKEVQMITKLCTEIIAALARL